MKLRGDCSVLELRGKYLLIVPSSSAGTHVRNLEVNDSFACLWNYAQGRVFSESDIADAIQREYELSKEESLEQARNLINLWQEEGLIIS